MHKWQNFYLQRMGTDTNGSAYPVCESVATWGVFCKDIPFILQDKMKEPAKRTWYDENGDDEFIPEGGLMAEAYTMEVELGCKKMSAGEAQKLSSASVDDVRQKVGQFVSYLRTSGMMKLYSSHTRTGRQNVRLSQLGKATWKSENGEEWLVFSVTLKVNDPVTDITLTA